MRVPAYAAARTVDEACELLSRYGAHAALLAGGTDLVVELRKPGSRRVRIVVDISRIEELCGITESQGRVSVGPLATHADLMESPVLLAHAPLLADAAAAIGSPQVRNRGTVGGNIMNAAACADTVPPLVALGAVATLRSKEGERRAELAGFFTGPYTTSAAPGELLTRVEFEALPTGTGSAFIKLGRRNALSIARLSVAAVLRTGPDGVISDARIVPGAAFPAWRRVGEAEQLLLGEKPSPSLFAEAGRLTAQAMIGVAGKRWSTEYKAPVLAVLVRRALEQCAAPGMPRVSPPGRRRGRAGSRPAPPAPDPGAVRVTINGRAMTLVVSPGQTLLGLLRDQLGLTGTKCGCEIGECGACTVLMDGAAVNSCLVPAPQIDGTGIVTVEGLMKDGRLDPLQESFMDHDAVHCGFCTPGMLMSAKALTTRHPHPEPGEIRNAISGNLCRCTGYVQIVEAIAGAGRRATVRPSSTNAQKETP